MHFPKMPNLNGFVLMNINRGSPQRVCGVTRMNKFIVLHCWDDDKDYLANVSNICWARQLPDGLIEIKFNNGPSKIFFNNGLELTEMLVGRPWYINIFNVVRWLFRKKYGVKNEK